MKCEMDCTEFKELGITACEGCCGKDRDTPTVFVRDNGDNTASFIGELVGMGF